MMTKEEQAIFQLSAVRSERDSLRELLDAERAAHQEPPDNTAWKSVLKYAYADGGDGVRNINSITSHYIAMRNKLQDAEKEIERLKSLVARDVDSHIKQGVAHHKIVQELVKALEPFAECNRGWIEDGKRAEIRFDWLQHAADAIAKAVLPAGDTLGLGEGK